MPVRSWARAVAASGSSTKRTVVPTLLAAVATVERSAAGSGPTTPTRSGCVRAVDQGGNDDGAGHDGQDQQRPDPEDPAPHPLPDLAGGHEAGVAQP